DISIPKKKLINFLNGLGKGQYTTFDILRAYQGSVTRNKGIPAECSWNSNFGKVLKLCQKDTNGTVIYEIQKNKKIIIDNGKTNTSVWEIY
ncbi:hypothetical protein, partial [Clostridium sp. IBUN13A]